MFLPLEYDDLARIRFVVSPWWETVTAVRAVVVDPALHRRWRTEVVGMMRRDPAFGVHWPLLRAFIGRDQFIADALTPSSTHDESFDETRRRVIAQPLDLWQADLVRLREAPARPDTVEILATFEADPADGVARLVAATTWFWELAVEPHWERLNALLVADIEHRARLLSRGGVEEMLRTLHPLVTRVPGGLDIAGKTCTLCNGVAGEGLTLVPSLFAWPGALVLDRKPFIRTLTYTPRGAGTMWEERECDPESASLGQLIGTTRAAILLAADVPMTTTQLAVQLQMAPATVSAHLKVLAGTRIVRPFRRGREVYYERTDLGARFATPVDEVVPT
ncbi:ArsR/SmtB family transcription factor [Microbacterium gorillae]|uniref:ArsR/SmtB family transcription factor n=1 Tax=Microbacterium gorillae TaxID=1231063 RepID=UPI0006940DBE|nr:DUF5937 family protein [Microbacterium gorillae]